MNEVRKKAKKDSLYITLIYVGIGSLALFSMLLPNLMSSEFYSSFALIIILLTFPVTIIGFYVSWNSGQDAFFLVPLIQNGVFILFWKILFNFLHKKYQLEEKSKI